MVQQLQSVPHSRADVEVLPDLEEVQDRMQLAMRTVDVISGSSEADLSVVMQSAHAAATAAASASSLVRYVLSPFCTSRSRPARYRRWALSNCMARSFSTGTPEWKVICGLAHELLLCKPCVAYAGWKN